MLESVNDREKLPLLPFNTLHMTEPYSPAFSTTPNHSGYGLMGQVSVLECRSYTWTKDKKTPASIKGKKVIHMGVGKNGQKPEPPSPPPGERLLGRK